MIDELIAQFNYDVKDCEQKMQIFIHEWITQCTDLKPSFFHFANERKTSWVQGKILKKMGVTPGVTDIFLSRSSHDGKAKGLWIELKSPGKKPTKEQLQFMDDRVKEGYWAFWTDDLKYAIDGIKLFYKIS